MRDKPTLHSDTYQRIGAFSVVLHFTVKTGSSKKRIIHTLKRVQDDSESAVDSYS